MKPRMNNLEAGAGVVKAMFGLSGYLAHCGLEQSLLSLLEFRVSQINGCAFCLDMHSKDLRAGGETEQRLYVLPAWRESPFYTDRERAALAWAEAVTVLGEGHVSDEVFAQARAQFSEEELANLTLAVIAINGWNRLNIAFRTTPGTYRVAGAKGAA